MCNYDEEWKKHESQRRLKFEYNIYIKERQKHRLKWIKEYKKNLNPLEKNMYEPDLMKLLYKKYDTEFPVHERFSKIKN